MNPIPPEIEARIQAELDGIQADRAVRVLFAVESGSRAWGFAGRDSDYDVRFVYVHRRDWYLTVQSKRDVIERPISDVLDVSGWELRKALLLFRKSNPPLLEWLRSGIVYRREEAFFRSLRDLSERYFAPKPCMYHYLHMARRNYREYLRADRVRIKKYFYVLRPLLACRWIERADEMAPLEFETLLEPGVPEPGLRAIVRDLLEKKRAGQELDSGPRIPELNAFIENEIAHFDESLARTAPRELPPYAELDELFRKTLGEWDGG